MTDVPESGLQARSMPAFLTTDRRPVREPLDLRAFPMRRDGREQAVVTCERVCNAKLRLWRLRGMPRLTWAAASLSYREAEQT